MAEQKEVQVNKSPKSGENDTVIVDTNASEVYEKENFEIHVLERKQQLSSLRTQVAQIKQQILTIGVAPLTEDLEEFKKKIEAIQGIQRKEELRKTLDVLERNYSNIEREVLAYDNWTKHGDKKG